MKMTEMKNGTIHLEVKGCVVNIKENLYDEHNRECTVVSIIPDNYMPDEKIWLLKGHAHNRIIQTEEILKN